SDSIHPVMIDNFNAPGPAPPADPCPKTAKPRSATTVSWAPGYGSGIDVTSDTTLSDRPEGIPRKLQIAVQEQDVRFDNRTAFMNDFASKLGLIGSQAGVTSQGDIGAFKKLRASIRKQSSNDYRLQRVTVENLM